MNDKVCVLVILSNDPLHLAFTRSFLHEGYPYVEFKDVFVISATQALKDKLDSVLPEKGIPFFLVHMSHKSGSAVKAFGITPEDLDYLKKIVTK